MNKLKLNKKELEKKVKSLEGSDFSVVEGDICGYSITVKENTFTSTSFIYYEDEDKRNDDLDKVMEYLTVKV
jgi:hypothetical protein